MMHDIILRDLQFHCYRILEYRRFVRTVSATMVVVQHRGLGLDSKGFFLGLFFQGLGQASIVSQNIYYSRIQTINRHSYY